MNTAHAIHESVDQQNAAHESVDQKSAFHESAVHHVQGSAAYIDDIPLTEGTLHAALDVSGKAPDRSPQHPGYPTWSRAVHSS